jgi:ribosomal protein S18 acetylase RimI-like enzyme
MKAIISVRSAAPRDLKALVAMCDALNAHSGLPTGRLDPKQYRAALFGKNAFLFADLAEAMERGEEHPSIAGYILTHDAFTTDFGERGMYVVDLYVEPGWRRAGVGKKLMAAAAARTKARGGTHLWWASMPANHPARRFYEALGATDERIHSHAVFDRPFEKLARAGMRRRPGRNGGAMG